MSNKEKRAPPALIIIGMAGSGKTTLLQRLNAYLHGKEQPPYTLNLDPAVSELPYTPNIDIRDTVDYKEVMKQYNMGPNGGILTALNLFTTKFDQVVELMEKRADQISHVLVDTPGQIEIFTWSASGAIITEAIASSHPAVVLYVIDTPRCNNPATFMSNMLYACSILYKTRLPFLLVFNKTDVQSHDFAVEWMTDFEAFQRDVHERDDTYMASLTGSMSLMLEEFYNCLNIVGVSAVTGEGIDALFAQVDKCVEEYEKEYRPEMERLKKEKEERLAEEKKRNVERLLSDLTLDA
ncbi:GPN-loop GTPase [Syncephalis pseudoplumigaleata]|uniref:GPN-loop GTPase n=1 Tax=Syncephalis pseudoplumigaleata TaxID=1712513 RepID=A0A4P9Z1P1_9FUNG|nr:GPN-loop GTPase [Syncephalis pseudoplumigaleata]|eukprot:RKP26265.1 GPN-loop GTPase [Syncephalis pseudoplumigaleata]